MPQMHSAAEANGFQCDHGTNHQDGKSEVVSSDPDRLQPDEVENKGSEPVTKEEFMRVAEWMWDTTSHSADLLLDLETIAGTQATHDQP